MENKWRASRYGIDGMLIDFGSEQRSAGARADARYLDFVDDVLDELDSREEVDAHPLDSGARHAAPTGSFAPTRTSGRDLKAVVEFMIEETKVGL